MMRRSFLGLMLLAGAVALSAAAEEPVAPKVLGVSHVALKVSDIAKARAFYKDFLGYEEEGQLNNKDGSLQLAFIKINEDQYLEIFTGLKPDEDRLYQVALHVEGIEALRAKLAAAGIKVPATVPHGRSGNANFSIKDPDGHTIEIVQYEPAGWTRRDQGKFLGASRISDSLKHAGFTVLDFEKSAKFYGGIFGFTETWRGSRNDKEISWVGMKVPDGPDYVELMLVPEVPDYKQLGTLNHISLEVPDIEKAKAALEARPYFKTYGKPLEIKTGRNKKRQMNLYDPDGTRVELMEPNTVDGIPAPSSTAPLPGRK